jgi:hypothetical protein
MAKGAAAGLALPRALLCLVVEEPWAGLLDAAAQGRGFPVHRVQPARSSGLRGAPSGLLVSLTIGPGGR